MAAVWPWEQLSHREGQETLLVLITESKKPGAGDQALSRPGPSDLCLSSMLHVLKVPEPPQTVPPAGSLLERGTSDLHHIPFLTSAYRTSTCGEGGSQDPMRADTQWLNPAKRENKNADLCDCPEVSWTHPGCPRSVLTSLPISSWLPHRQRSAHILNLICKQRHFFIRLSARPMFVLLIGILVSQGRLLLLCLLKRNAWKE